MARVSRNRFSKVIKKPSVRYRKFRNDKGKLEEFTVYIIHGRSEDWKKVDEFINKELRFRTVVSINKFKGGNIFAKIKRAVWFECDCAVAILSPDDILKTGEKNARPNVLFEMGYCMGHWDQYYWEDEDLEPVILIKESKVQIASDLKGIEFIEYDAGRIHQSFETLREGLENIYDYLRMEE